MIYADSSVIVKRYYHEPGSRRLRESWRRFDRVFTSRVAYAEVHAALARKRREGGISSGQARKLKNEFEAEWHAYDQILVDQATSAHVRRLVSRHTLRGFDAIHLSAALWLREQIEEVVDFWGSDERLIAAADAEGFPVVNPEL